MPIINSQVKPFKATAFKNGDFVQVSDADLKGKSSAAVKGAKSQGDEMRSEAGALHSEAKGEVGKRTGQLESPADVKAKADVKADMKAGGKLKADKK